MFGFGNRKYESKVEFLSEIVLGVAVLFEILILLYFNFFRVKSGIDQDYAQLIYHGMEMARSHKILLDNWIYSSTAEFDSPMLLAAFFMGVIKNPYYSFALANTINIIVFALVLNRLMNNAEASTRSKLLAFAFIYLAYDFGVLNYTNMMFIRGGQYYIKTLLSILFVTILTIPKDQRKNWSSIAFQVLLYLILFVASFSSGISIFVTCLLPVIVCAFFYYMNEEHGNDKLFYYMHFCTSLLITVLGVGTEKLCGLHNKAEAFMIRKDMVITEALVETVGDLFSCLRVFPVTPVSAMSIEGVSVAIRWCIIALFCVGFASAYRGLGVYLFGKDTENVPVRDFTKAALMSVFVVSFIIQLMTKSRGRYHVPGNIAVMVVAALSIEEYADKIKEVSRDVLYLSCGVLFLIDSFFNLKYDAQHWIAGEKSEYIVNFEANEQIKSLFDEYGIEIAYTNESNQIRAGMQLVDPDRVYYIYNSNGALGGSWDQHAPLRYMDNSVLPEKNAFIGLNMDIVPDYIKQNYTDVGPIGPYQVLISDNNPLDPVCVIDYDQQTIDLPSNPNYERIGELDGYGYLHTTEEGNVLQSPWISAPCAFSYELNYTWDGEGSVSCDVYKDEEFFGSGALESGEGKLQLSFEEPGNYMFVIFKQGTGELTVKESYFEGIK